MKNIGIIGFGNMGESLAKGLLKHAGEYSLSVSEKEGSRIAIARERYQLLVFKKLPKLIDESDIVIIAVKPQDTIELFEELKTIKKSIATGNKGVISVVTGKKIEVYREFFGINNVARFMPNIAAKTGKAIVGVSISETADENFEQECTKIANSIGEAFPIPEKLMAAMTGISGSGIAYVLQFIHAMAYGGVSSGIPYSDSIKVVTKVIEGALSLLHTNNKGPVQLITEIASPAGTTVEGLKLLEEKAFTYSVMEAVKKATDKAKALEG